MSQAMVGPLPLIYKSLRQLPPYGFMVREIVVIFRAISYEQTQRDVG